MNTELWQEFESGLEYQQRMGFRDKFPQYIRFKEGDQWAPPTARTKNLPRPVFNIVEMFIRSKRATVLSQPVSITFKAGDVLPEKLADAEQGARDLTDYARMLWERCEQDSLNSELVDDAATLGTGILHYYFDSSASGNGDFPFAGEIRGESIDPLNIIFGNPQERNVQKQPYIIIASRRNVKEVRDLAKRYGVEKRFIDSIACDNEHIAENYDSARNEMRGDEKCTLLTKYYKKNGVVHYDRAVRNVELIHGQSLSPKGRDEITLYPIAVMPWQLRKKCIFGIGEAEGIIPNQKAINFNLAMLLLSVQQTAWPKLLSTPGAIRQPVTNEPGEHIIDHSPAGSGIRYLNPPAFSSTATNLSTIVMELSRTIGGVTEVATGEMTGKNMAASAIIALQNQAKTPILEIQRRYWNTVKQIGKIWLQFIRSYYVIERKIRVSTPNGYETKSFSGNKYHGIDFDLAIDAGPSSEYGEALSQSVLDHFLERGYISFEQYVELAPDGVIPFREKLRQMIADAKMQDLQYSDAQDEEKDASVVDGTVIPKIANVTDGVVYPN